MKVTCSLRISLPHRSFSELSPPTNRSASPSRARQAAASASTYITSQEKRKEGGVRRGGDGDAV
jgi:hypothetical protein